MERICDALRNFPLNPRIFPEDILAMFEAHFQTFEEPEGGVALTARLSAFR